MTTVSRPLSASQLGSPKSRSPFIMTSPDSATPASRSTAEPQLSHSDSLVPPSPYPQFLDPSPVDSNGTDGTEIDDEAQDETPGTNIGREGKKQSEVDGMAAAAVTSPTNSANLAKLDTNIVLPQAAPSDDAPISVIHVPTHFKNLVSEAPLSAVHQASERVVTSPNTPDAAIGPDDKRLSSQSATEPRETSVDTASTAKQPFQKGNQPAGTPSSLTPSSTNVSFIAGDTDGDDVQIINVDGDLTYGCGFEETREVSAKLLELQDALSNTWASCRNFATLSSGYRAGLITASAHSSLQENAWNSCWRLCQELYDHKDQPLSNVHKEIELCRAFAQARFDVRSKGDPRMDGVLRVSFEMCTHCYNIRDRTLPPAFIKRTMDFYVAFCHRMIGTKSVLPREMDALLASCWTLAEALYNLQNRTRVDMAHEEDLTGSAVQACFSLLNLFQKGWTQSHSRTQSTPRATQTTFQIARTASNGRTSSLSDSTYHDAASFARHQPPLPPETPITIIDDMTAPSTPDSTAPPNILVLGPDASASSAHAQSRSGYFGRRSSSASGLSELSDARNTSQRSSSTIQREAENHHLKMLRVLLLKPALDAGFAPPSSPTPSTSSGGSPEGLGDFVAHLPRTHFGSSAAQIELFDNYRGLVVTDPSLGDVSSLLGGLYAASDIAKAVVWLSKGNPDQWGWMRDLFQHVLSGGVERMRRSQVELEL